ncbi:Ankyrin repeat protein [Leptospira santarosai]|uniref:Ankyrin repeat protein n=1 Tax=Leptospira santarosai TaxID=28183 RepID=A0A2P1QXK8_9LEPT|nr:Ankyrin repeat protein [Leptospira santarosai]
MLSRTFYQITKMFKNVALLGIVTFFLATGFIVPSEPKDSAQAKIDEEFIKVIGIRKDYDSRDIDKIERLLKHGANVHAMIRVDDWPYYGDIPVIHYVAAFRSFAMLRMLITHGADPETSLPQHNATTLTAAIDCARDNLTADCLDKAEYLLGHFHIDLNAQERVGMDSSGVTALMSAVGRTCSFDDCHETHDLRRRSLELIRNLLAKGANANLKKSGDDWPETALLIAISNSDKEVAELLIENGAEILVPEKTSAIDRCILNSRPNTMLCDYLASKGAKFNSNLLIRATQAWAYRDVTKAINYLIQRNLSLNFQDSQSGNTALHAAAKLCERGNDIFQRLIAAGASDQIKNTEGRTAHEILRSCQKSLIHIQKSKS